MGIDAGRVGRSKGMADVYGKRVDHEEGTVGSCMVEGVFGLYYSTTVLLILVQHAHYGIDTNNYIESWHSSLKRNYIGRGGKQKRMDFIIRILTQDVEPDYMRAHIRSGLGFRSRKLCKAEQEAQKIAESLAFEEAEESVREVSEYAVFIFIFSWIICLIFSLFFSSRLTP